jgi:hypothetical protein
MRRLTTLCLVAVGLLAAGLVTPASATIGEKGYLAGCQGSGGYSGGTWSFSQSEDPVLGQPLCRIWDPDQFPVPSLVVPPNVPPSPTVDPDDPVGTVLSVLSTLCDPEPDLCPALLNAVFFALGNPISTLTLDGTGDFACGNGSLSGTGYLFPGGVTPAFDLVWEATLTNGVGTITGTATDAWYGTGQTWTLSGKIFVNDGSAVPGGCDDSAGNSQVGMLFTLTP